MDILFSAIVGDLISRSVSFVISRYFQKQPGIDKVVQRLQTVVLRIDIVVEEAEGRRITNQGMLRQLKILRQDEPVYYWTLEKSCILIIPNGWGIIPWSNRELIVLVEEIHTFHYATMHPLYSQQLIQSNQCYELKPAREEVG